MNTPAWKPTLAWHAKFFGALLACVTAGYFILSYAAAKLPAPYQKRSPTPEATPWLNR